MTTLATTKGWTTHLFFYGFYGYFLRVLKKNPYLSLNEWENKGFSLSLLFVQILKRYCFHSFQMYFLENSAPLNLCNTWKPFNIFSQIPPQLILLKTLWGSKFQSHNRSSPIGSSLCGSPWVLAPPPVHSLVSMFFLSLSFSAANLVTPSIYLLVH